ncbi:DUF6496 domain-containing protein [Microvirga arabica]|uniref:DUF6496 domain-containing protein n=1 Tax=Microvirga arabica TaxID=1128671 RepID=A0ABV6Y6P0_9HYPH|nr:DUF6496 domain-containing protein [Microvirga arabica]MBM1174532.1 hypothetical protein [Microvirga arabica]
MAKQSKAQKDTVHRVMHEFKEGKLKIRGSGPKVKNPKQAIAIALHEAGASNQESPKKNRENLSKTKSKERRGETASKKSVSKKTASPRERLSGKASKAGRAKTRAELYAEAKRRDLPGRSRMSKAELERSLHR